ncbi:MAG: DNA-directed RNA polymerase subunit A' [Candidatus Micrarchaeota archaeon]
MKVIQAVGFSIFSPDQIRKMSSVKITVPDTYDEDGYPISGGLADQKLGVVDPGLKCRTCGGRMKDCPGHPGHVELIRPVVHVGFAKLIYQLLKLSCRKCSRIMHLAASIEEAKRPLECPHCGEKQKKIKFVKPTGYYEEDRKLLPNEVRERLEHIPDEDLRGFGIEIRPEWAVMTVLIAPPVTVRPSITLETGERSEDDLTHKLVDILRINQRLEENIEAGAPQLIIEDLWELLQYHVTTYFDNETSGIPPARHRSGRQLKTLFQRLKGKEGRFRYNLSGKRVNFSARTVISPDPTLGINEIGIPIEIAKELTVPVSVTQWNLEAVKEMIRNFADKINYVIRPDGKRKKITIANLEEILQELTPGYTVERQLFDGDLVIFNRQPSLHRVSMLCHEVKVLPGKTFRFNVADCTPYNADFDGDEMNIHVPQTEEAQSEAELLMKVQDNILSPRNGSPLIAPDLDQITGLYLLSLEDFVVSKKEACGLLNAAGVNAKIEKNVVNGRDIFSMILPEDFDFEHEGKANKVRIKHGKFSEGFLDASVNRDIVKKIFDGLGSEEARKYIDKATKLSVELVYRYGFSLSLKDYYLPESARAEINELYSEGMTRLNELVKKYKMKKLERLPGKTLKETLEEQVMNIVDLIRFHCWNIVKEKISKTPVEINGRMFNHNPSLLMASAGVKNKPINVVQMAALVGQQAVRGKRPVSGFRNRLLPHFKRGDLGDNARGFVKSNYKSGLTAVEYFFHAAGGRDGVVDKGVNPAKTGYMQRRLINALQDFIAAEDGSVRDSEDKVIQFKYGGDGMDPSTGKQIAYGEPVGVVAAQSIGEPGTQMTLRTFHYAGVASLAQFGFTRLVELVDARKTPKKPVMELFLKKSMAGDFEKVKEVAARIEEVVLDDVAEIKENFDRKLVSIVLDTTALRERGVREKSVVEEMAKIAPNFKQDGSEITIKTKEDSLKSIRKMTTKLRELHLGGIAGIRKAIIVEKKGDSGGKEYAIATDGSNLQEIFKVAEVDASRTGTNDIMEINEVLGVEAARNAIVQEIKKVLQMQDLSVDERHIKLIADSMAFLGKIKSVGRHGLAGQKKSVLARAAFEETAKHLLNACIYGEEDELKGIAENIIIGQTIPAGTGKVKLQMKFG